MVKTNTEHLFCDKPQSQVSITAFIRDPDGHQDLGLVVRDQGLGIRDWGIAKATPSTL